MPGRRLTAAQALTVTLAGSNAVYVCKAMIVPPCAAVALTRITLATCGAICSDACRELLLAAAQQCPDAFTYSYLQLWEQCARICWPPLHA